MKSFLLNKLVRDKILADMQGLGQQVTYRKLDDAGYLRELHKKLLEEAGEFDAAKPDDALKELTDVLEVVEALAKQLGTDFTGLRKLQAESREKRGGFETRTFVERLDLADDDPWVAYYAKDPERFKEIQE